jgi:hypothetical protein
MQAGLPLSPIVLRPVSIAETLPKKQETKQSSPVFIIFL